MLSSAQEILEKAQLLAKRLEEAYQASNGSDWTRQVFEELRKFSQRELGLEATDCFYKDHPEGKGEFLWDFIAVGPGRGILLAAESEQETHSAGSVLDLKHDFEKLLYVYAPMRALICKAKNERDAESLVHSLKEYAHNCCKNFNPGSTFLLHFRLRDEKRGLTYMWQSEGEPFRVREEVLDFARLDFRS